MYIYIYIYIYIYTHTQAVKCNCINKPDCPISNQCQITNIIYKAKITSNLRNYHKKNILRNQGRYI